MGQGTPEGVILRSMGGDMAEAIEEKTGLDLRAVTDPEALLIIRDLLATARKMFPDYNGVPNRKRKMVEKILKDQERKIRTDQFMSWQHRLHQDLSVMSLGLGNVDDYLDLDNVLMPDLDKFEDLEERETD